MKILLVTDQFYAANNGMTISARRFAKVLREHGHTVRVLSYGQQEDIGEGEAYLLKKQYIPVFDKLISSQGMTFAKADDEIITQAVGWADIVHFLVPFALSHHGIKIARELGVPYTAAFHVQPENITASVYMANLNLVNDGIYKWFHHYIYKYCSHIHCPSNFIAQELRKAGYTEKLHVISNGIDPDFRYRKIPKTEEFWGKFVILMVGRLSNEKRQDVLIRAISESKYKQKIKLVLAGKGPRRETFEKLAQKCGVDTKIKFFNKSDLMDLIAMSDLYVHAADMEIEAMSCMEAFAGGLVPVIANSKKSATPQFALDDRSLFEAGNSEALARKIDYWIEHEQERKEMEHAYSNLANKYNLDRCVLQAEAMFAEAIRERG